MSKTRFAYLFILAAIGLAASFIITVEKINLLVNPSYVTSCSLNPIISCSSVMESAQASTFGFPNSILGIISFSMLLVFSVLGLMGTVFNKKIYLLGNAAALFGAAFSVYLFTQSTYEIGAVCLYCLAVWFSSLLIFSEFTTFNLKSRVDLSRFSWWGGVIWLVLVVMIYLRFKFQFDLYYFS
jgi:uncharacterized membrane protein